MWAIIAPVERAALPRHCHGCNFITERMAGTSPEKRSARLCGERDEKRSAPRIIIAVESAVVWYLIAHVP